MTLNSTSLSAQQTLTAWVHTLRYEAQDIISVELRPASTTATTATTAANTALTPAAEFPPFEAGAHIDLHLPNSMVRSYSLLNDCRERHRYVLGILKDHQSKGGSRCVHEQLRIGTVLTISAPRNNFALNESAEHSVLIAGGIGITPILCMAKRLKALGKSFEVMYFARTRNSAAFVQEIKDLGVPTTWHFDDEVGAPPDLKTLLARLAPHADTHHYACGPAALLDAFEAHCQTLGHPHVHIERFAAVEKAAALDAKNSYHVELRRSGIHFDVTPETSLHQCLIAHKANVPFSCEEGICGSCETRVIEGDIDHRDSVLSPAERGQNKVMMVCVSGCKSDRLVLDI